MIRADYKNLPYASIFLLLLFLTTPVAVGYMFFDNYMIKLWFVEFFNSIITLLFIWQFYSGKIRAIPNRVCLILMFTYLCIDLISYFTIPQPTRYIVYNSIVFLINCLLLCLYVSIYLDTDYWRKIAIRIVIFTLIPVNLLAWWNKEMGMRIISTLGNENFLGGYLVYALPLLISYMFYKVNIRKQENNGIMKVCTNILIYGLLLFFSLNTLFLTRCRGGMIGLGCALIIIFLLGLIRREVQLYALLSVFLCIFLLILSPVGIKIIISQFTTGVRPHIWMGALNMFLDKPLFGWGYGSYYVFYPIYRVYSYWLEEAAVDLTRHAHCEYLEILAEMGVTGLIVFSVFIGYILWRTFCRIRGMEENNPSRWLLLGFFSSVVGVLVHNLVSVNLRMYSSAIYFWLFIGVLMGYEKMEINISPLSNRTKRIILGVLTIIIWVILWFGPVKEIISRYYFQRGIDCKEVDSGKALPYYTKAIRWNYYDPEMHYRCAYIYYKLKRYEDAIREYKIIRKSAPYYGNIHKNMALIYKKLGNYRLAIKQLLLALRINPYDIFANRMLIEIDNLFQKRHKKTNLSFGKDHYSDIISSFFKKDFAGTVK